MEIRPIRNDKDHAAALRLIERFWGASDGTREADALDVLATLVDVYENSRWPVGKLDPIAAIKEHMAATGRTRADLAKVLGSRSRASELMARKRPLTINMLRALASQWHLPAELLLPPYDLKSAGTRKTAAPTRKQARSGGGMKRSRSGVAA
jgi:antitoxin component HigA of HigAB toxin-antitoxin module